MVAGPVGRWLAGPGARCGAGPPGRRGGVWESSRPPGRASV